MWQSIKARSTIIRLQAIKPGDQYNPVNLGAIAKGGTSELVVVIQYAEPIKTKGLVFMDSPGYDPVSVTGQVASGANVVCFTT